MVRRNPINVRNGQNGPGVGCRFEESGLKSEPSEPGAWPKMRGTRLEKVLTSYTCRAVRLENETDERFGISI